MKFKEISLKIIELKSRDLALRDRLIEKGILGQGYHDEMAKLHNSNAAQLNEIIDEIGYPTADKVGKEGSAASWLVIQHAIGQPEFMKRSATLLKNEVEENNADPIDLAYLTDRIAVFEGKPQLYGTQYDWDENGQLSPNEYDDINIVNERRKTLGFNTMEEQTQIMRDRAILENESPPKDFDKRKAEMEDWRKSVGWVK